MNCHKKARSPVVVLIDAGYPASKWREEEGEIP
jgi:hypothetical protein